MLGSGPNDHAGECPECTQGPRPIHTAGYLEDLPKELLEDYESDLLYKESCQMVDARGCELKFWVAKLNSQRGHEVHLWVERDSILCPKTLVGIFIEYNLLE